MITLKTSIAPPILAWRFACTLTYTIFRSGDILIDVEGIPQGAFPQTLARIGLTLALPGDLKQVAWYGRGPGEAYSGTKQANHFGVYRKQVEELFTPYERPQENGNRTDVCWVTLTNARGVGLFAAISPQFNFSAHHYSAAEIEQARHHYELQARKEIILHLDLAQHGIGSASCGPGVLPQYELRTCQFAFQARLKPLISDLLSPMALSRMGFCPHRLCLLPQISVRKMEEFECVQSNHCWERTSRVTSTSLQSSICSRFFLPWGATPRCLRSVERIAHFYLSATPFEQPATGDERPHRHVIASFDLA